MILELGFILTILISSSYAIQGDDMSDEDFAEYLEFHKDVGTSASQHAESAGRGCVKGATTAAVTGKGFQALCIGCAVGAAGELTADLAFPKKEK